jgi:hypothetical protein
MQSSVAPSPEIHKSGEHITVSQPGSLVCVGCGFGFSIASIDALPECPNCGGARFRRTSLFSRPTPDAGTLELEEEGPEWLDEVRADLSTGCACVAFERDPGTVETFELEPGWTRIGRSGSADIRLDDATVSRRHALIVLTEEGHVRALDDRSLNGLFVNCERVEWAPLGDGDAVDIGRYRLYLVTA